MSVKDIDASKSRCEIFYLMTPPPPPIWIDPLDWFYFERNLDCFKKILDILSLQIEDIKSGGKQLSLPT